LHEDEEWLIDVATDDLGLVPLNLCNNKNNNDTIQTKHTKKTKRNENNNEQKTRQIRMIIRKTFVYLSMIEKENTTTRTNQKVLI